MHPIALAALLTILPTEPGTVANGLPVTVTAVQVEGANGQTHTVRQLAAGRSARVPGATRVLSFEMSACPLEARLALHDAGDPLERESCWRALERSSPALARAPAEARADLERVLFSPPSQHAEVGDAAARVLPELVSVVVEEGALGTEVASLLDGLGLGTPAAQLRGVPRTRRPALLTVLGRHEDGRAFGLLARAALESSVEAERAAAVRALADYPEDTVQRLSNALEDPSPSIRRHAAEALRGQDRRATAALVTALQALGVAPLDADGAPAQAMVERLIEAHRGQLAARAQHEENVAQGALTRGDLARATEALGRLESVDRERFAAARPLRARRHLVAAAQTLSGPGAIEERGRAAADALASAEGLDPQASGLVDVALQLGRFLLDAGYPASAARVLGPYEERDERVAALRTRALRDEVRRRVQAGDDAGARARLTQLVQEGQSDLADELDAQYGIRPGGVWMAPASVGLFLCSCIGFAVRRERRRRRTEFELIETEDDRGKFHAGPYR